MATIKAIEGSSVHRIQSSQVIVDLCSVVKELVENSLDARATSIDVRFKTNGLETIEVQDNGGGISKENYETVALKHCTSKLSSYDDLTSLQTFGFRGEALSSLCALSDFHIVTARDEEAPKGTRLDFETSGKVKGISVVASQKGTTVVVANIFNNLPVRRRELEKNIKREYGKVLAILQAYASISLNAKFSISNQMPKGKKAVVFATKSNPAVRENIANIFGAKTLTALIPLNLSFELQPSVGSMEEMKGEGRNQVRILGHISRPIFGEGRQTPDRQMFFVNARPCGLPQVARAFNEVYKSYNISQSPFILANLVLNTHAYDVNVSPDKRTILLHEQTALLESLRVALNELFEKQDQTVPQMQKTGNKLQSFRQLTIDRTHLGSEACKDPEAENTKTPVDMEINEASASQLPPGGTASEFANRIPTSLIQEFVDSHAKPRASKPANQAKVVDNEIGLSKPKQKLVNKLNKQSIQQNDESRASSNIVQPDDAEKNIESISIPVSDFNQRIAEQQADEGRELSTSSSPEPGEDISAVRNIGLIPTGGPLQTALDRMRPRRSQSETATITIGSKTFLSKMGQSAKRRRITELTASTHSPQLGSDQSAKKRFSSSIQAFTAQGYISRNESSEDNDDEHVEVSELASDNENSYWANESDYAASVINPESDNIANVARMDETPVDHMIDSENCDSDSDFIVDEEIVKAKAESQVAQLIGEAEEKASKPSEDVMKRTHQFFKGSRQNDSTVHLVRAISTSIDDIIRQLQDLEQGLQETIKGVSETNTDDVSEEQSAEESLSLIVAKKDFARMSIIGQFNLGFILGIRLSVSPHSSDELFIIDQHASDEIYNFESLQSSTIVQSQRLVQPRALDLTAIEEEIVIENLDALLKNGFVVQVDQSGEEPVGQRCKLLSLPMSREVTFDIRDLEELLVLLADSSVTSSSTTASVNIPRPSKVRKMFAMRACRSSVMIGKTLTKSQMQKLIRNMGTIDKPWNCPHGRPTMRHLASLGAWEGWREGDGVAGLEEARLNYVDWVSWTSDMMGLDEKDGSNV